MSTVYNLDPTQDPRWADLVEKHPRASIFHTRGWLEALRRTYGYRPIAFTTSSPAGELKNALVFARVRSWLTGRRIVSLPFSDHCEPLFDSSDELDFVLGYLQAEMDHQEWKYIEVRPINGTLNSTSGGFRPATSYYLHRVDLQPKLDDIFQSLDKDSVRRRIQRAQRAELIEKCGQSEDLLKAFYDLLVPARKRHELPPQPYIWFKNLVDCLGEAVEIRLACNKEGIPVAAILTLRFKDKVFYKYGCSNTQFNNLGGMPFLLWRAIENGKTTGAKELDLGRSDDDNPGLITFKDKWTRNSSRLVYWRFPPPPSCNSKVEWKSKIAKRVFASMPNSVLMAAGKLLYRHMG
jgi:hypothetical protein